MQNELKGRLMLKVVGILYIISACLAIVLGLLILAGGGLFAAAGGSDGFLMAGVAVFLGIFVIFSSALSLVFGILAVRWCNRPDKARTLFIMGIVLLVLAVVDLVAVFVQGTSIMSGLLGLVLPILYTIGAHWNEESAQPPTL